MQLNLTGNQVFDFFFNLISLFAFTGWGIGLVKGRITRWLKG